MKSEEYWKFVCPYEGCNFGCMSSKLMDQHIDGHIKAAEALAKKEEENE